MWIELAKEYGPKAGWPVAILFVFLYVRQSGELTACMDKPEAVPVSVSATAKTLTTLKIVYKDRMIEVPGQAGYLPCPDIELSSAGEVSTQTEMPQAKQPKPKLNAIFLGAGYIEGLTAQAGYGYGPWRAYGQVGENRYGGGLTFDMLRW